MKQNKVPPFSFEIKKILDGRPQFVAVEAVKFFKEGFQKSGFTNTSFVPWKKRVGPLGGKRILIGYGNTMNLMQSIRTLEKTKNTVRTGSDLEYAQIHNDGGTITVTAKMKRFWWAKYREFAGKITKTKTGKTSGNARNRTLNTKAEYCKNMALMKVGSKIKIPQRQFIGESKTLMTQFETWFTNEIEKIK